MLLAAIMAQTSVDRSLGEMTKLSKSDKYSTMLQHRIIKRVGI
jgi:hypothetical protein